MRIGVGGRLTTREGTMLLIDEVPELTNNARRVLDARYLIRNAAGEVIETPDQMFRRVAANVSRSELAYGASEAERLAVGTGWLPVMFRGQEAAVEVKAKAGSEVGGDADVSADASGSAHSEVHEDAHAVA